MTESKSAGNQLDSKALFERQSNFRENGNFIPGPVIVAVGLTVPENQGMVLRLADAVWASQVIFVNEASAVRARIHKTARNADTLVPWQVLTLAEFSQEIDSLPRLVAIELTTRSTSLFTTRLAEQCTFVVGSEQYGIPAQILEQCEMAVHIPLFGVNGSMNVTHALAVALFEWRRQRSILKITPYAYPKGKQATDAVT